MMAEGGIKDSARGLWATIHVATETLLVHSSVWCFPPRLDCPARSSPDVSHSSFITRAPPPSDFEEPEFI